MKFLTFTDVHGDAKNIKELVARAKKDDIDFVLTCGDFTTFSRNIKWVLKQFNAIGKKVYLIPGNHEEGNEELDEILKEYTNCINFDRDVVEIGGYFFLGYGGGGFAVKDPEFRKKAREWYGEYKDKKVVFVTHGPAHGTKIDKLEMGHVGNKDYRKFIERIQPKLAISGHIHETKEMTDSIGKTKLVNPGWDGMVIELK